MQWQEFTPPGTLHIVKERVNNILQSIIDLHSLYFIYYITLFRFAASSKYIKTDSRLFQFMIDITKSIMEKIETNDGLTTKITQIYLENTIFTNQTIWFSAITNLFLKENRFKTIIFCILFTHIYKKLFWYII